MTWWHRLADRSAAKLERRGLEYPLWVPASAMLLEVGLTAGAVIQREGGLLAWTAVGIVIVTASHVVQAAATRWVACWITAAIVLAGVAIVMSTPYDGAVDLAPAVLAILVAETTASEGVWRGAAVTVLSWGVVVLGHTPQPLLSSGEIAMGLLVGTMLVWLTRALVAERHERARENERATLAERQRIAREIHDVLAHSMSVTLLQVAGARRALLDDDLGEAEAALADAEEVGRAALADIRRTVGLLADGDGTTSPQPGGHDLEQLIDSMRSAGLDLDTSISGDPGVLSNSVGLAVYRVAQEALTNAVRHAPGRPVSLRLDLGRRTSLRVENPVPAGAARSSGGHGLDGMRARADQIGARLQAGPFGDRWVVALDLPESDTGCAVTRRMR